MEHPSYQTQDFISLGDNHINVWRPAQGRCKNDSLLIVYDVGRVDLKLI